MLLAADDALCLRYELYGTVSYTRRALRFQWRSVKHPTKGEFFVQEGSTRKTIVPPLYTPEENFGAKKFQSVW